MENHTLYIGHIDLGTLKILKATVEKIGHTIVGSGCTREEMVAFCEATPPDLIISSAEYPDGDGIEGLIEISRERVVPAIVIARKENIHKVERAIDDHVMAYLIDPITPDDLKPTIHVVIRRFEQFEELKQENDDLRAALETRKVMERAKGILMAKHGITEEDAYLKLRNLATSRRIKLSEVAAVIIEAETKKNA